MQSQVNEEQKQSNENRVQSWTQSNIPINHRNKGRNDTNLNQSENPQGIYKQNEKVKEQVERNRQKIEKKREQINIKKYDINELNINGQNKNTMVPIQKNHQSQSESTNARKKQS